MQIIICVLIDWNQATHSGSSGTFRIPEAYTNCCEEQAIYTIYSCVSIWIENFYEVRDPLFQQNKHTRHKSNKELEMYFDNIAQAGFGDSFDFERTPRKTAT